MHLPRVLARMNRYVNNPIQRRWAGRLRGYGILEHVGRKSGRPYRTPLNVFRSADGFVIWIGYGLESDWLRNTLAAGGATMLYRGKRYRVTNPEVVTGEAGRALLPVVYRILSKITNDKNVLTLTATPE